MASGFASVNPFWICDFGFGGFHLPSRLYGLIGRASRPLAAFRRNIEGSCRATRSNTMNATFGTEGRALGSPLQGFVFPGDCRSPWALPRAVIVRPFGPLKCPNSRRKGSRLSVQQANSKAFGLGRLPESRRSGTTHLLRWCAAVGSTGYITHRAAAEGARAGDYAESNRGRGRARGT
jgi:hypothetical protein